MKVKKIYSLEHSDYNKNYETGGSILKKCYRQFSCLFVLPTMVVEECL